MKKVVLPNEILLPEVVRLLKEDERVTLRVKGNSMLPFIVGERDSVVLGPVRTLKKGDIVLAQLADGRFVIHRIIAIGDNRIALMGDGNSYATENCIRKDVSGIVVKIIRNGKVIECESLSERSRVKLWNYLKPVRRYMLAVYRRIK